MSRLNSPDILKPRINKISTSRAIEYCFFHTKTNQLFLDYSCVCVCDDTFEQKLKGHPQEMKYSIDLLLFLGFGLGLVNGASNHYYSRPNPPSPHPPSRYSSPSPPTSALNMRDTASSSKDVGKQGAKAVASSLVPSKLTKPEPVHWDLNRHQSQIEFFCLVNRERAKLGLRSVYLTISLNEAAEKFALLDSPSQEGLELSPEEFERYLMQDIPIISALKHLETNYCLTVEHCFQDILNQGKGEIIKADFTRMGVGAYNGDNEMHVSLVLAADGSRPQWSRWTVERLCRGK